MTDSSGIMIDISDLFVGKIQTTNFQWKGNHFEELVESCLQRFVSARSSVRCGKWRERVKFFCFGDYAKLSPNYNCMCAVFVAPAAAFNSSLELFRSKGLCTHYRLSMKFYDGISACNRSAYTSIWLWSAEQSRSMAERSSVCNRIDSVRVCMRFKTIFLVFLLAFSFSFSIVVNLLNAKFSFENSCSVRQ